jgi:L-lactate dehydrogenase complex protein LldG
VIATESAGQVEQLVATFASKVEPLGVLVHRLPGIGAAAELTSHIADERDVRSVVISDELRRAAPGLTAALESNGLMWTVPENANDARDKPIGLSLTRMAVAETGSVLLAEPTLADRSVGLVTRTNLVICDIANLAVSLDEAGVTLREIALRPGGGYAALVTGPSRTADIEMSLTVGVQGPAVVHVVFVDDLTGQG